MSNELPTFTPSECTIIDDFFRVLHCAISAFGVPVVDGDMFDLSAVTSYNERDYSFLIHFDVVERDPFNFIVALEFFIGCKLKIKETLDMSASLGEIVTTLRSLFTSLPKAKPIEHDDSTIITIALMTHLGGLH